MDHLDCFGPFWTVLDCLDPFEPAGLFWTIFDHLDHFGPFRTVLHFGPFWTVWTILDHFGPYGPFCAYATGLCYVPSFDLIDPLICGWVPFNGRVFVYVFVFVFVFLMSPHLDLDLIDPLICEWVPFNGPAGSLGSYLAQPTSLQSTSSS